MASRSRSATPLALASLVDTGRLGLRLGQLPSARPNSQADVLRIFVPQLVGRNAPGSRRGYSAASTAVRPGTLVAAGKHNLAVLQRAGPFAASGAAQRRWQHVEPQRSTSSSSSSPSAPAPGSSGKKPQSGAADAEKSGPNADALYQTAGPPPSGPVSTSHISRVLPAASSSGAELGSASNQVSASQAQLAEKQQKELEAKEALEKWKQQPLLKRAWIKVKEEAAHYWHGSKLLAKEVKISSRLLRRLLLGYSLTRREKRQLKRTTADLLRLIPFIPFIIVPAGELLLPVAIKIFPNMLPSTFESKFAVEAKRRGLIKVRLEMAKFLQETIKEGGIRASDKLQTSDEFKEFFRKVRTTGDKPTDEDITRFARLFDDDLTLDNLTRPQLVSMCRYMQINAFGTDNFLRYQIRNKLQRIKRDDMTISAEGLDNMSLHELQSACQNRGIQTLNLSEARLREELGQWIQLHLNQRISGTLLILSKAFNYMPQGTETGALSQLKSLELTLSSLPDNLISEAELNVSKDSATNKQRLEVLQQQEELIEDEAEQEQAEEEARRVEKERKKSEAERRRLSREESEARALLPKGEVEPEAADIRMTNEQLTELGEALSILSAKSSVLREREELAALIKEVSDVGEEGSAEASEASSSSSSSSSGGTDGSSSDEAAAQAAAEQKEKHRSSGAQRGLAKRVKSMLEKIDAQLEAYDADVGSRMNIIEASPSGKISVDDLEQALRLIKHRPDEEVLEKLVDKLDVDNDGLIPLADLVELARQETGLGIVRDDEVQDISRQGAALREERRKPRREDIVE